MLGPVVMVSRSFDPFVSGYSEASMGSDLVIASVGFFAQCTWFL